MKPRNVVFLCLSAIPNAAASAPTENNSALNIYIYIYYHGVGFDCKAIEILDRLKYTRASLICPYCC